MEHIDQKRLAAINYGIVGYFVFVFILYLLGIHASIAGILREVFYLPMTLAAIVFAVFSVRYYRRYKEELTRKTELSILLIIACTLLSLIRFI